MGTFFALSSEKPKSLIRHYVIRLLVLVYLGDYESVVFVDCLGELNLEFNSEFFDCIIVTVIQIDARNIAGEAVLELIRTNSLRTYLCARRETVGELSDPYNSQDHRQSGSLLQEVGCSQPNLQMHFSV